MRRSSENARNVALAVLREWSVTNVFVDALLHDALTRSNLSARDRAFATELVYGVIRNLRLLDFWIAQLRSAHIDAQTRDVLRLGLHQLLLLKTAEHAAIYQTVELARAHTRGVVNAVLRTAQRMREELLRLADDTPLAVRASHPDFLIDRWTAQFGIENTRALCDWNNRPAPIFVRVNRLKTTIADVRARYPDAQPVESAPAMLRFNELPGDVLAAGEGYVQDPSTLVACELLSPRPGDRVLDACAAPGGKSGYIGELMENSGLIVAADRDAQRAELLRVNVDRLGVNIAEVAHCDWTQPDRIAPISHAAPFDRILVDAPCSNTGVMGRRVDVRWRLTSADFSRMHATQITILRAAVPFLKQRGVLVYSTCSIEPEENEAVVQQLASEFPELQLDTTELRLPFRDQVDGAFAARFARRT